MSDRSWGKTKLSLSSMVWDDRDSDTGRRYLQGGTGNSRLELLVTGQPCRAVSRIMFACSSMEHLLDSL